MGGLISVLYGARKEEVEEEEGTIKVDELLERDELAAQILEYITQDTYREQIYACDFYKGLDKRVPVRDDQEVVWRMNADHTIVYVLVADLGQQPIHINNDAYGAIVVYPDDAIQEAIQGMQELISSMGHTIYNEPIQETEEDEKEAPTE